MNRRRKKENILQCNKFFFYLYIILIEFVKKSGKWDKNLTKKKVIFEMTKFSKK